MIGQLLLTVPMAAILAYGTLELRRSRVVGVGIVGLTIAALLFIWAPGIAESVAVALQLGSGRDLVLYAWIVLVTLILLNLHLRMRRHMQVVAAVSRQIAIAGLQEPQGQTSPSSFGT
jgi:hypothetical protein